MMQTFKSPMVAVLLPLLSFAIAQTQLGLQSKAADDWLPDPQRPRAVAGAGNPETRLQLTGKRWTGDSAERRRAAAKLGYYVAPKSTGERPERASGGGDGTSDRGRPGGSGESAGGGNADSGNAGGGNAGGRSTGDRNAGDGNAGDSSAGGGISGDRSGDRGSGASGQGNNGGGSKGGRE